MIRFHMHIQVICHPLLVFHWQRPIFPPQNPFPMGKFHDRPPQRFFVTKDSGDSLEDFWESTSTYLSDDFTDGPLPEERPALGGFGRDF